MTTLFLKEPFAAAFGKKEIAVDYGKKNVQPAHYYPCKRKDVEAMFRTPSPKHRGSSNASQSSKASIKGNLADVKKMEEMLEDSAGESLDDEDEDMVEENGSEEDESEHEAESEKDADSEELEESEEAQEGEDEEASEAEGSDSQESEDEESVKEEEKEEKEEKDVKDGKKEKHEATGAGAELAVVTQDTNQRTENLRNSTLSFHSNIFLLP